MNYPATLNSFRSCLKVIDTFRSVLLGNRFFPQTMTITHTIWAMFGRLPVAAVQAPHRHQSVAVDLVVDAKPGCYTLVGKTLGPDGRIKDGERFDWQPHAVFVTPPGLWHSHHNESGFPAHILPFQDAGLHTYLRTFDIRFARSTARGGAEAAENTGSDPLQLSGGPQATDGHSLPVPQWAVGRVTELCMVGDWARQEKPSQCRHRRFCRPAAAVGALNGEPVALPRDDGSHDPSAPHLLSTSSPNVVAMRVSKRPVPASMRGSAAIAALIRSEALASAGVRSAGQGNLGVGKSEPVGRAAMDRLDTLAPSELDKDWIHAGAYQRPSSPSVTPCTTAVPFVFNVAAAGSIDCT